MRALSDDIAWTPPLRLDWYGPISRGRGRRRRTDGPSLWVKSSGVSLGSYRIDLKPITEEVMDMQAVPDRRHHRRQYRDPWPCHYEGVVTGLDADTAARALFGIPSLDLLHGALISRDYRLFPQKTGYGVAMTWAVPVDRIRAFEHSRRRAKYHGAIQMRYAPDLKAYLADRIAAEQPEDWFEGVKLDIPRPARRPLEIYRCEACEKTGAYADFEERMIAGLATPVGLACVGCEPRDIGAMELAFGRPQGRVVRAADQPCLFPPRGPAGKQTYG